MFTQFARTILALLLICVSIMSATEARAEKAWSAEQYPGTYKAGLVSDPWAAANMLLDEAKRQRPDWAAKGLEICPGQTPPTGPNDGWPIGIRYFDSGTPTACFGFNLWANA